MKKLKKLKISRKTAQRAVYILVIIALAIYGLKDAEVAVKLIKAVVEAFSIIL